MVDVSETQVAKADIDDAKYLVVELGGQGHINNIVEGSLYNSVDEAVNDLWDNDIEMFDEDTVILQVTGAFEIVRRDHYDVKKREL